MLATCGCESVAAISGQHCRDAVPAGRSSKTVPAQLSVVVSMGVEEARGDSKPVSIDGPLCRAVDVPNAGNEAVADSDVAISARRSGSVDYAPVLDQDVKRHCSPRIPRARVRVW